jgi:hypothetical protein
MKTALLLLASAGVCAAVNPYFSETYSGYPPQSSYNPNFWTVNNLTCLAFLVHS